MISPGRPVVVAVIGPGEASDELCALAREVGCRLAEAGAVVVTGGLGGVMAAAAEGARSAGGLVIGVLPGNDRTAANDHVSVAIPTGLGQARNAVVVGSADAVIAVGGSWGTLSEIALARRTGTPVVGLRGWSVRDEAGRAVELATAGSAADAVAAVLTLIKSPQAGL